MPLKAAHNQRGIAQLLELFLLVAILVIAGFVGMRVYQAGRHKQPAPISSPVAPPKSNLGALIITDKDDGKTLMVKPNSRFHLHLSNELVWKVPTSEGVKLTFLQVQYKTDPGYQDWEVMGSAIGSSVISAEGSANCPVSSRVSCPNFVRFFRVTISITNASPATAQKTPTPIVGVLKDITDCGGTAESTPQCGYVLQTNDHTYSLQGEPAFQYEGKDSQYVGKSFRVSGTLHTGATNTFGLPEPDFIEVTSMIPQ